MWGCALLHVRCLSSLYCYRLLGPRTSTQCNGRPTTCRNTMIQRKISLSKFKTPVIFFALQKYGRYLLLLL